ncbi:hypothetical protein NARC_60055 [Candidatus Nitrosocosmicus arcticus]|uniref:Uncharacterized protein n=1 Tax=Candidatus Nitrosocosmicus arcticus TaxID=2035267 RepID=A0A557SVN4_9ARCH|nr:hypothetical protein NARC_60055 [Candidatus Nitrosocosmicus arcticus]
MFEKQCKFVTPSHVHLHVSSTGWFGPKASDAPLNNFGNKADEDIARLIPNRKGKQKNY